MTAVTPCSTCDGLGWINPIDGDRGGSTPCPACDGHGWIEGMPMVPPATEPARPPFARDRLRAALAARLGDDAIRDAADMLAATFRNGDLDTLRFVLDVMGEDDGRDEERGVIG